MLSFISFNNFIQDNLLIVFTLVFWFFYISCIKQDIAQSFFVFFLIVNIIFILVFYLKKNDRISSSIEEELAFIEKDMIMFMPIIDNPKIYIISKPPNSLKYSKQNHQTRNIIYKLKHLRTFHKSSYYLLITYLEYFMMYHFYIMMNHYSVEAYLPLLKDIRSEILNISKSFVMSVPPGDDIIAQVHEDLQSFTYRYIQIIKNKFNVRNQDIFNPPYGKNDVIENNYSLFS